MYLPKIIDKIIDMINGYRHYFLKSIKKNTMSESVKYFKGEFRSKKINVLIYL